MRSIQVPDSLLKAVTDANRRALEANKAWHKRYSEIGMERAILGGDMREEALFRAAQEADQDLLHACRRFTAFVEGTR